MNKTPSVLGILGGLGPMASVYFYELLTKHTAARCDQDHIDVIINSRATTPDRTAYILGQSTENPFDIMEADAHRLVTSGADVLAIPCNTAHYFYDKLEQTAGVPILNMVEETVLHVQRRGVKKPALLATAGTVAAKTYQRVFEKYNMDFAVPDEAHQAMVTHIIYGDIKQGKRADMAAFDAVVAHMKAQGCDGAILGCTELSLIKRDEHLGPFFTDSMEVLCRCAIEMFGKTPIGFEED